MMKKNITIKALVKLLLLLNINIICAEKILFTSHKTAEGSLDADFLNQMKKIFNIDIFVESGTYNGGTTEIASKIFNEVHTIELDKKMFSEAKNKFQHNKKIFVYEGSSAEIFKTLLPDLEKNKNVLFFLDAHYCGQGTAVDKEGPDSGDGITAIRKEINAIKNSKTENCVIIVDDIRGFGTKIDDKEFIGCWAYPTVQDVCSNLLEINSKFVFYLVGDMLLAYDKTKYAVDFSPIVKACTVSRLFDGSNYTNDEVIEAELIISKVDGPEKEFLKKLCEGMNHYKDPEFHHELWSGLMCLGEQIGKRAYLHFNNVLERSYSDPRIYYYLQKSQI